VCNFFDIFCDRLKSLDFIIDYTSSWSVRVWRCRCGFRRRLSCFTRPIWRGEVW